MIGGAIGDGFTVFTIEDPGMIILEAAVCAFPLLGLFKHFSSNPGTCDP